MFARSVLAAVIVASVAGPSRADLILTPQAQAAGYQLVLFADRFPSDSFALGPLGIGFVAGGGVMVSDAPGNVRIFPSDADGQHASSVPVAQNYGLRNAVDIAQVGNSFYMSRQGIGDLIQVNPNGTFNHVIVTGMPAATGVATNPANGHIFVSTITTNAIYDVDPIAKTKTLFINQIFDGITISSDGKTLYGAISTGSLIGHILGYDIATKALGSSAVFPSAFNRSHTHPR